MRRIGPLKPAVPLVLLALLGWPRSRWWTRVPALGLLASVWTYSYVRYRAGARAETARQRELLRTANWETFSRVYNEKVVTIEEEFDVWGEYHQHRHEMRYDLISDAASRACPDGGVVLDLGCGSALVADRLARRDVTYVGVDYGGHHIAYAKAKHDAGHAALATVFARSAAEALPFADASFDVVVFSEVIEHLMQPELAVWEIARVLNPGGTLVMTTNNASEVPLRSPLTHLFAWLEKALGAYHPSLISLRPWIWPYKVDRSLLPPGAPDVWVPHTHHIYAETRAMFAAAGFGGFRFSTFEFPPPQAKLAKFFDARGARGRRAVDVLERVCRAIPLVNRLGCHMLVVCEKQRAPVAPTPPAGVWPGPFSEA
ncbi:MAG: 2-polyprenyl-6-hydroxyphenyl methylase / 3-demethylubiquinone-9 3-methyltransferase [Actinomycetota bacterium]|jgi:ubiquinone/menaquinone biosynthesis C-methylase UbiE